MLAPIGPQVQLNCSAVQGYGVRWLVTSSGGSPRSTAAVDAVTRLGSLGISFKPLSITAQESVLTVNGTEGNNGTTVVCIAVLLTGTEDMECSSEEVLMIFYGMNMLAANKLWILPPAGPPSSPADLAATEKGVGSVNISWSLVTIEGVAVTFTVTVMNLNDSSSTGPMEVSGIQDQHYIFTLEDSTSCDLYSFQVTAVNGAGTGTPSEIITRSLPSLPDISPVQDSLQHSLVRTASGVILSVTFNVCPYTCLNLELHNLSLGVVDLLIGGCGLLWVDTSM